MNNIAILTSICGIKNPLVDPKEVYVGVDYIAFVDKHHDCKIWQQYLATDFTMDFEFQGRRNAKIYKVLPHLMCPGYDYYFWVDSTHEVIQHPEKIISEYLKDGIIGVFNHTHRNCVYDEGAIVASLKYDDPKIVYDQLNYYESIKYPRHNGLYELPVSIRKNTPEIQRLNLRWWEQICKYSSRDQISFPVVLWSLGITPTILPGYANNGFDQNPIMPQKRSKL